MKILKLTPSISMGLKKDIEKIVFKTWSEDIVSQDFDSMVNQLFSLFAKEKEKLIKEVEKMKREGSIVLQQEGETIEEVSKRQYTNECSIYYYNEALNKVINLLKLKRRKIGEELFDLEQRLDIPYKDRFYKTEKINKQI